MVDVYNPFMVILGMAYYLLSSRWRTLIHLLAIELTVKQNSPSKSQGSLDPRKFSWSFES